MLISPNNLKHCVVFLLHYGADAAQGPTQLILMFADGAIENKQLFADSSQRGFAKPGDDLKPMRKQTYTHLEKPSFNVAVNRKTGTQRWPCNRDSPELSTLRFVPAPVSRISACCRACIIFLDPGAEYTVCTPLRSFSQTFGMLQMQSLDR